LTPNIFLFRSPGHTAQDITTIVHRVNGNSTVAIVGKTIKHTIGCCHSNQINLTINIQFKVICLQMKLISIFLNIGQLYRQIQINKLKIENFIICMADKIIPGHGKQFLVTEHLRSRFECKHQPNASIGKS